GGILLLERMHWKTLAAAHYTKAFEQRLSRLQPDVLFCTHQRSLKAVPAMVAAKKCGIPSATFIYSWDNVPKSRMPVQTDHYLVWSNFMKEEMLAYYPGTTKAQMKVVGTPQFEHYFNDALAQSRETFLGALGLNASGPVVCFSGDDTATSPNDALYLADLAKAVRTIDPTTRPQILFRRCPVDGTKRYDNTLRQYPEIVVCDPLWIDTGVGDFREVVPLREDIALLANLMRYCDLIVNVGSTMAMDMAIFDKPAIYLAYNLPAPAIPWDHNVTYSLPHFRTVHELQPVYWARSAGELAPLVRHALRHPGEKAAERRAWVKKIVHQPMDQASARCKQALDQIAAKSRSHGFSTSRAGTKRL
ncbi:MAG: hypothetical protein L0Z50_08000, partial [Verrucomicrobiales bacterium]|nr:hypothetical protein [Verrucomicrobiales bacterium]